MNTHAPLIQTKVPTPTHKSTKGSGIPPDMSKGYTTSGHAPPSPPANLTCRSQRPGQGMGTLCLWWSTSCSCHPNTCPLVPYCTSRRRPGTASTNSWSVSITALTGGGGPPPPGGRYVRSPRRAHRSTGGVKTTKQREPRRCSRNWVSCGTRG